MASSIRDNLELVLERIANAALSVGRSPTEVTLVAATKTQSIDRIADYRDACLALGVHPVCGENYAQELGEKSKIFPDIEWHFIGRLQRNKASLVVESAGLIESVGSIKILKAIDDQALRRKIRKNILLQINISEDFAKDGFLATELDSLAGEIHAVTGVLVSGVMTILEHGLSRGQIEEYYSRLQSLAAGLKRSGIINPGSPAAAQISMGMSDDFDVAIAAGATMVRVGTAIFGKRSKVNI